MRELETINLAADEWEALRLCDQQGLYHAQAAEQMDVSRQTLGLILRRARHKTADALLNGKAISMQAPQAGLHINSRPGPRRQHRRRGCRGINTTKEAKPCRQETEPDQWDKEV